MHLIIREHTTGEVLADASREQVIKEEGNWYVSPGAVSRDHLEVTHHEYICPYKGRCLYVDALVEGRRVPRVGWVYNDPKPEWKHIAGRFGFYGGSTAKRLGKTTEELSEE